MQKPQASSSSRRSLSHIWSWGLAEGLGWSQQGWRGHPPWQPDVALWKAASRSG